MRIQGQRRRALLLLAVIISLLSTACGSEETAPPVRQSPTSYSEQPPGFDITFQWIPSATLDPMSAEGTFVRAYIESHELARDGGGTAWAYPGFIGASLPDISWLVQHQSSDIDFTGTLFYRALRREMNGDVVTLTLCRYGYGSSTGDWSFGTGPQETGTTARPPWGVRSFNPRPLIVAFETSGPPPPTGQRGSHRAPGSDVFGDWQVTTFDFVPRDPIKGVTPDYARCETDLTGIPPLPTFEETYQEHPNAPLPPSPGWPGVGL